MERRDFLRAGAGLGIAGLAGCTGMFETRSSLSRQFTTVEDREEKVYYPTHEEGMAMLGMSGNGRYRAGLMYSIPHAFWTITGTNLELNQVGQNVTAHVMATIWDDETGTVLPTANVSGTFYKDGEETDSRSLWTMISQNMGYHFGDNVELDGDGSYTAELSVGAMQTRRMGDLRGAFEDGTTVEVAFEHSRDTLSELPYEQLPDKQGDAGALDPMDMDMPMAQVPKLGDLPGMLATAASGDADFAVFQPDENPHFVGDDRTYLAVSPRTPYNRYPLPFMSLSATLQRGDSTVFDDVLLPAVDPELGYHYGAGVDSISSDDSLTVTVDAPPQISRHEGYETAFVQMPEMTMTI